MLRTTKSLLFRDVISLVNNETYSEYAPLKDVADARGKVILSMKVMLNISRKLQGKEELRLKHEQFGWLKLKDWYKLPKWHLEYCENQKNKIDNYIISRKGIKSKSSLNS